MKRLVLSLALVLAAATQGHALRSGSAKSLTVQNGAATMGCVTDGGTGNALFFDSDGTTATQSAACTALPTCSAGAFLTWGGSSFSCGTPSASSSVNLIATQSHTPVSAGGTAGQLYMGLGGALRNTTISLQQIQGTATFKNLRCMVNNNVTAGQTMTVELGYLTAYAGTFTSFSTPFTVLLNSDNNTNGPTNTATTSATPTGAWIGYRLDYTSNFPQSAAEGEIYCTVERAS